jgi:tRNA threonylcarbamoyladenosine biosynthesis protein TsaB
MSRILVIETATSICSVALLESGRVWAEDTREAGRTHAECLLPMIAALPDGGKAERIWVNAGPGSFTGIRVGLAAARALGFAWDAPCLGYSTMALLAADGFAAQPHLERLGVVILGGHGELFTQIFTTSSHGLHAVTPLASLVPEAAAAQLHGLSLCGNAAHLMGASDIIPTTLSAPGTLLLGESFFSPATALYGRGADAKPQARAA